MTQHAHRPRRGRLIFSLFAILVFVGLLPLALFARKLMTSNREALTTSQQQVELLLAGSIASELDIHIDGIRAQLAGLGRLVGGAIQRGSGGAARAQVRELVADIQDDRIVFVRYSDLRRLTVDTGGPGEIPAALEKAFVAGFVRAAEGLAADHRGVVDAVSVSDPILVGTEPRRAVIVVTAPVVAGDAFRGAVFAVVDLHAIWETVAAHKRAGHAMFAVDRTGRLFAARDLLGASPGESMARSGIVERFLNGPGRQIETKPFLWSEGGAPEWYIGSYEVTRQGWGVFVQARQRLVYEPIERIRDETLRWALLAISLALLAAVVFAGTLSKPINRLAEASRAFARGDFAARVVVRSRNEIGELADTFNAMASELEEVIRRLKRAAEENNELFIGTARALATAIDAKDPYTRGHSVRVNRYAVIVGRHYGLSPQDLADIHVASLLHDVGKIGIDDAILKKPALLTADEFEIMKQHTVLGAQIMSPIRKMKSIIPGLRSHHERWQGGGYPDNLRGDQIPLMARIIAVADSFDAMTTERPYQRAMTFDAALARLNQLKGIVFDDRVVEAFNRAYVSGEIATDEEPARTAAVGAPA